MKLALNGGGKERNKQFKSWPDYTLGDYQNVAEKLNNTSLFRSVLFPGFWEEESLENLNLIENFEKEFSDMHDCRYGFGVCSGSVALDLALYTLNLSNEDEVLVTPYTYFASAGAIKGNGAKPVFVDINANTLNMDVDKAEKAITQNTKAMVIVHFGGIPAQMDKYTELARKYNLRIIEDCAHTVFASFNGTPTGAFGDAGCYSFQASKLISSGEGGAIVTNDFEKAKLMFSIHNGGRNYDEMKKLDDYFDEVGSNYRLSTMNFALLNIGLEKAKIHYNVRKNNAEYLLKRFEQIEGLSVIKDDNPKVQRDYYIVAVRYDKEKFRNVDLDIFLKALNAEGIPCGKGYKRPLYYFDVLLDNEEQIEKYKNKCVETEKALKEIFWFSHEIFLGTQEDMDDIVNAIIKIKENIEELL